MTTLSQRSFSGGELAPSLYARVDTVKYATGVRTMRNMYVMRHGGAASRPGTQFVGEVSDSTKTVKLIPFVFNSEQTYMLEFGDGYMRVMRDGAHLTDLDLSITGITQANPAVVTYTGDDPSNGDEVAIFSVGGMTQLNNRNFKVANVNAGANTFELQYMDGTAVNSTSFGAYTSGGTASRIYTIETPYLEADLQTLQFVQSADVVTITHRGYPPKELSRSGHTSWSLSTISFEPEIAAPGGLGASGAGAGSVTAAYKITAIAEETLEESLPSAEVSAASTTYPINVTWGAVSGAQEYNVYKKKNGVFGFIGVAVGTSFSDTDIEIDTEDTPPTARNPFDSSGNYPGAVTYIQQRRGFGSTDNEPETSWLTRTGKFKNLTVSSPIQDDDAVTFTFAGRQVNQIRHLIDLGNLVALTSDAEWVVQGDASGIIKPGEVNPKAQTYNGSSTLPPIVADGTALYVQARGTIVRDLAFDYQVDKYRGNDISIFATHLFEKYTLVDWAFQKTPHSVIWAVRSDGTLLGCTYVREHQVLGWHHHDFDGVVENAAVIPEGSEDAVYLVIRRTVNGATKRYIERMYTRQVDDIKDFVAMDAALTYDGRNTDSSHTMTLSGGTTWGHLENLTLTSSDAFFISSDVGNVIQLTGADGTLIRFTIKEYTSSTVVTGRAHKTVPVGMRSTAISSWVRAVDQVTGLWHLEGKEVSVFADGFVVASPNNDSYVIRTIENGALELDRPYGVIHVGLPFICDLETLNIDTAQGETLADKKKNIGKVTAHLEASRGLFVGPRPPEDDDEDPLQDLNELKIRDEESYDDPVDLVTDEVEIIIQPQWNSNGRVFLRQVDPLPLSVLSIAPAGFMPFSG